MATVNLGSLRFDWKGAYNGSTAYAVDDVVSYNGSSYICILASTGNLPTNTTYFQPMATKGTDGTDVGTTLTTQGDILYRDGSGLQRLGAGTSGQFLKTQGTGANPVWANLASNVDIVNYTAFNNTGVNSMSVTTDWSSNNYWKFEIFGQYQMNAAQGSKFRLRNSSGDITSQTYSHVGYYSHATEAHNSDTLALHRDLNGGLDNVSINGWGFNASRINPNFTIHLYKPDPNGRQSLHRQYYNNDPSGSPYHANYSDYYWTSDTSTKTGFTIVGNNSANFINGFVITLGYKYQ